jgi:hypothetical protein
VFSAIELKYAEWLNASAQAIHAQGKLLERSRKQIEPTRISLSSM